MTTESHQTQDVVNRFKKGTYIPPYLFFTLGKARELDINNKSSLAYQQLYFSNLRKSINGLINKASENNIKEIAVGLFQENLSRGKGLFIDSILKSVLISPIYCHIFAALVSIINSKLPEIGELLLISLILKFRDR
jgi:pre-mRNA-splicing factor CWC22